MGVRIKITEQKDGWYYVNGKLVNTNKEGYDKYLTSFERKCLDEVIKTLKEEN